MAATGLYKSKENKVIAGVVRVLETLKM